MNITCYRDVCAFILKKKIHCQEYWIRHSMCDVFELINSENKNILRNVGIDSYKAFTIKNEVLHVHGN